MSRLRSALCTSASGWTARVSCARCGCQRARRSRWPPLPRACFGTASPRPPIARRLFRCLPARDRSMSPPDRKRATALNYGPVQNAPKIVATGQGVIAERILEIAAAAGVPIREDEALVNALCSLELGQEIPEDLFVAVAEALAWAYRLDRAARG